MAEKIWLLRLDLFLNDEEKYEAKFRCEKLKQDFYLNENKDEYIETDPASVYSRLEIPKSINVRKSYSGKYMTYIGILDREYSDELIEKLKHELKIL